MTEERRAHIAHLLVQQKYEEALPILDDLVDSNPPDRELRMYHLLVVRILMLRWHLSRAATDKPLSDSPATSTGISRRLDLAARVSESTKFVQSLGRMYQAAATTLVNRSTKRIIAAGAGFVFVITLLAFQMQEGGNAAIPVHSKVVASTIASNAADSSLHAKVERLNRSATSDENGRLALWSVETGEGNLFRLAYETENLIPTEHVKQSTRLKPALSRADTAKATSRPNPSDRLAGRQKGRKVLTPKSPVEPAANESIGNISPIKVLATYKSGRAIPIRESPRFAARAVQDIDSGISLNVLEFVGSWAKVEIEPGTTGFVRREFLIPVKANELNVARTSPSPEEK